MESGELSESSGDRHPAEDLIVQKALRRAAAAEASSTDVRHMLEEAAPAHPPGLELLPDAPPGLAASPESHEGSAAADGEAPEPPRRKRKSKKKAGAHAKEEAKAKMAQNLQRHLAALHAPGGAEAELAGGEQHANGARPHAQPADGADMDAMSLHSSDSEEAGIALGNAPDVVRGGAKRRKLGLSMLAGGVRVVGDDEETARAPEMQRLLRQPRYFDEDFEAAALRCFKCGGQGHMSRDCPNEQRPRPCYLCAQFGHTRAQCTNALCYICQQPGHMARDCPNGRPPAPVCLRCGRDDCPAAEGDYVRAEGGCAYEYAEADLAQALCPDCGQRGHLGCARPNEELPAYKPSCFNCGQRGHTGEACRMEWTATLQNERRGQRRAAPGVSIDDRLVSYDDIWGSGKSNGSQENGYDRWQGGDARSQPSYEGRGGSTYAQRVSRMRARSGSEGHRSEHLRWEDEEDSYEASLPPERPWQGRRYGRR